LQRPRNRVPRCPRQSFRRAQSSFSNSDDVRRLPGQMLASVESNHLTRDRWCLPKVANSSAKLRQIRAATQYETLYLLLEVIEALPFVGERWTGTDGIDADVWRQRLRHRFCRHPQRGLGERIAIEARVGPPDTLVNHVHDEPFCIRAYIAGERMGDERRGLHVNVEMV